MSNKGHIIHDILLLNEAYNVAICSFMKKQINQLFPWYWQNHVQYRSIAIAENTHTLHITYYRKSKPWQPVFLILDLIFELWLTKLYINRIFFTSKIVLKIQSSNHGSQAC